MAGAASIGSQLDMTKLRSDGLHGQSQLAALTSLPKPGLDKKKFATKLVSQLQRRENVGDYVTPARHDMTGP